MDSETAGTRPAGALGPEERAADVPAPTLLTGMATAVAAGAFVGWALLPLQTTVASLPVFAVVAVATTLWSGISFLRRRLPTGVLAEGFYLMGVAVVARPTALLAAAAEPATFATGFGGAFVTGLVALVVAGVLLAAGWRLDTHARKRRIREARRRLGRRMSRNGSREMTLGGGSAVHPPSDQRPEPRPEVPAGYGPESGPGTGSERNRDRDQ